MVWDVITVTLNSEKYINRCISSVKEQKSVHYNHVVFDGGSNDSTVKIVESLASSKLKLVRGKDSGIYDAINQAIALTVNDFVAILHSDDYFDDDYILSNIQRCFESDPSLDIIYCKVNYRHKTNSPVIRCSETPNPKSLKKFYLLGGQLAHPGIFVRRRVYEKIKYHSDFLISADYLFQLKCFFEHKLNFMVTREGSVTQQTGGTSQRDLKAFWVGKKELYKIWKMHLRRSAFISFSILLLNIFRKSLMYLTKKLNFLGSK